MLKNIKEKKRSKFVPKKSSRKKESPQNCPQKHQRKGKVNQDCNVFSRVSLATRDKAFLENCHCHGHPHERMQEQRGDSDAFDASCDVSDEKRDIHQLL